MPNMNDIKMDAKADWYTTIDLRNGFFQMALSEESKRYTCFGNPSLGYYEHNVLPMGCCISPGHFHCKLSVLLRSLSKYLTQFVDDILVKTNGTVEFHLSIVRKVFVELERIGAQVEPSKVVLAQREIKFLGLVLSNSG